MQRTEPCGFSSPSSSPALTVDIGMSGLAGASSEPFLAFGPPGLVKIRAFCSTWALPHSGVYYRLRCSDLICGSISNLPSRTLLAKYRAGYARPAPGIATCFFLPVDPDLRNGSRFSLAQTLRWKMRYLPRTGILVSSSICTRDTSKRWYDGLGTPYSTGYTEWRVLVLHAWTRQLLPGLGNM